MKKTEKMIHQNIRFRSRIDTFLVSIEEFPSPTVPRPRNSCSSILHKGGGDVVFAWLLDLLVPMPIHPAVHLPVWAASRLKVCHVFVSVGGFRVGEFCSILWKLHDPSPYPNSIGAKFQGKHWHWRDCCVIPGCTAVIFPTTDIAI